MKITLIELDLWYSIAIHQISTHFNLRLHLHIYHMQVHSSGNYIPVVESPPKHTSPPSMAATFLIICLMAVLQTSGYSVFQGGNTPIQLGLS